MEARQLISILTLNRAIYKKKKDENETDIIW